MGCYSSVMVDPNGPNEDNMELLAESEIEYLVTKDGKR
jgi:hypothetical protein